MTPKLLQGAAKTAVKDLRYWNGTKYVSAKSAKVWDGSKYVTVWQSGPPPIPAPPQTISLGSINNPYLITVDDIGQLYVLTDDGGTYRIGLDRNITQILGWIGYSSQMVCSGSTVYYTPSGDSTVTKLVGNAYSHSASTPEQLISVAAIGDTIYTSGSDGLYKITAAGVVTRIGTAPMIGQPYGGFATLAADPVNQVLYGALYQWTTLHKITTSGVITQIPVAANLGTIIRLVVDPTTGNIIVVNVDGTVLIYYVATGNVLGYASGNLDACVDRSGHLYMLDYYTETIKTRAAGTWA